MRGSLSDRCVGQGRGRTSVSEAAAAADMSCWHDSTIDQYTVIP
jgi:hypothetical protein